MVHPPCRSACHAPSFVQGILPKVVQSWLPRAPPLPSVSAISMYKWNGILQLNSAVVVGPGAALAKYIVELFQLGIARGSNVHATVWAINEKLSTWVLAILGAYELL